jgi:hypothetical protein
MPLSQKPICTRDKLSGEDRPMTSSFPDLNQLCRERVVER